MCNTPEACIEAYFEGLRTSKREPLEQAFHPSAQVVGPDEGELKVMSREQFIKFAMKQAPDESIATQTVRIDTVGDIATAVVTDEYIGRKFVDHLAMVRLEGRWQIYTKLWHVAGRLS